MKFLHDWILVRLRRSRGPLITAPASGQAATCSIECRKSGEQTAAPPESPERNIHFRLSVNPQSLYARNLDFLKPLEEERFEAFTFRPAGMAVYQLGNNGTAQRQLKAWSWKN